MNKWLGSGRLTDNPVLKYDSDRAVFATFTIMCVRDGKIPDGGQAVDFIDCKCTGHNAEFAKNFLRKDKKVEIVGRLESGHYTAAWRKKNLYKDRPRLRNQLCRNKGRGRSAKTDKGKRTGSTAGAGK